jgi:hypothetical protein
MKKKFVKPVKANLMKKPAAKSKAKAKAKPSSLLSDLEESDSDKPVSKKLIQKVPIMKDVHSTEDEEEDEEDGSDGEEEEEETDADGSDDEEDEEVNY